MALDQWVTLEADAALYVDLGVMAILCDRLPRPVTLVLKNPTLRDGGSLVAPEAACATSLAGRGGMSANCHDTASPDLTTPSQSASHGGSE